MLILNSYSLSFNLIDYRDNNPFERMVSSFLVLLRVVSFFSKPHFGTIINPVFGTWVSVETEIQRSHFKPQTSEVVVGSQQIRNVCNHWNYPQVLSVARRESVKMFLGSRSSVETQTAEAQTEWSDREEQQACWVNSSVIPWYQLNHFSWNQFKTLLPRFVCLRMIYLWPVVEYFS